jgi:peroxiredoxin
MPIQVGKPAPEFTLKGFASPDAQAPQEFSLSQFKGQKNVVVLFFPLVYTPVCTTEMCGVRDTISQFSDLKAQVLAISVDNPFAQRAWAKENRLNFPVLSDFNKEVSAKYDTLFADLKGWKGVSKRSAFVIDRQGIVRYAECSDDPGKLPSFPAIQDCLKTIG